MTSLALVLRGMPDLKLTMLDVGANQVQPGPSLLHPYPIVEHCLARPQCRGPRLIDQPLADWRRWRHSALQHPRARQEPSVAEG
eukprot:2731439-Prymnesium_polylepis.1